MQKEDDHRCSLNKVLSFLSMAVAITVEISGSSWPKTRKFHHVLWKIFMFWKQYMLSVSVCQCFLLYICHFIILSLSHMLRFVWKWDFWHMQILDVFLCSSVSLSSFDMLITFWSCILGTLHVRLHRSVHVHSYTCCDWRIQNLEAFLQDTYLHV